MIRFRAQLENDIYCVHSLRSHTHCFSRLRLYSSRAVLCTSLSLSNTFVVNKHHQQQQQQPLTLALLALNIVHGLTLLICLSVNDSLSLSMFLERTGPLPTAEQFRDARETLEKATTEGTSTTNGHGQ